MWGQYKAYSISLHICCLKPLWMLSHFLTCGLKLQYTMLISSFYQVLYKFVHLNYYWRISLFECNRLHEALWICTYNQLSIFPDEDFFQEYFYYYHFKYMYDEIRNTAEKPSFYKSLAICVCSYAVSCITKISTSF